MKTANALGFLVTGLIMMGLPTLAPEVVTTGGGFGETTRTLWLQFMGTLNAGIGVGYIGHAASASVAPVLATLRTAIAGRPALQRGGAAATFERA